MTQCENHKCVSSILNDTLNHQKNNTLSMNERLQFLYPLVIENKIPLPRNLSLEDKSSTAIIDSNNPFRLEYSPDPVVTNYYESRDNGCVRANNPIPLNAGIYYFEIKILSKGVHGRAYIGLTSSDSDLTRAPGWDLDTYGYHGDDGKKFAAQHRGDPYGPTFSTNDIVGCGVNFENQTCFFTKNGSCLGIAFREMPMTNLYPTVGHGSNNEAMEVNFGQSPFLYNIKMEMLLHDSHTKDLTKDLKMKRKNIHRR